MTWVFGSICIVPVGEYQEKEIWITEKNNEDDEQKQVNKPILH